MRRAGLHIMGAALALAGISAIGSAPAMDLSEPFGAPLPGEGRRNRPSPADTTPAYQRKTPTTAGDYDRKLDAATKRRMRAEKRARDWASTAAAYYCAKEA